MPNKKQAAETVETTAPLTGGDITRGAASRPGFRADGSAYPGVDPVTGQRMTVTYEGLREEFGEAKGTRLYNLIAVAAFGGVLRHRPDLDLRTLAEEYARQDINEARREKRRQRRDKVTELLEMAEREA